MIKETAWILFIVWALVWAFLAALDESHCKDHGMAYDHTHPITLSGYCRDGDTVRPAEEVGR